MQGRYVLYLSDIPFHFGDDREVIRFAEKLFGHCTDGGKLYDILISSNAGLVYESCIDESLTEDSQIRIMKSLSVLHQAYGAYFDPDERIFSIKNRLTIQ